MPPKGSSKKKARANTVRSKFAVQRRRAPDGFTGFPVGTPPVAEHGVVAASLLAISKAALSSLAATTPREVRQSRHHLTDALGEASERLTPLEEGFQTIVVQKMLMVTPEQTSPQKQLERSQWLREIGGEARLTGRAVKKRLTQSPQALKDALRTNRALTTSHTQVSTRWLYELYCSSWLLIHWDTLIWLHGELLRIHGPSYFCVWWKRLKRYLDDHTKLFLAQAIVFNAFMSKVPLSLPLNV